MGAISKDKHYDDVTAKRGLLVTSQVDFHSGLTYEWNLCSCKEGFITTVNGQTSYSDDESDYVHRHDVTQVSCSCGKYDRCQSRESLD